MKLFKFNNTDINHWITSDLHLNHNKTFIFEKRGYSSIEEHNSKIIENINSLVKEEDILFNLGDFCLNTTEEQFEKLISSINCKNIYSLWGNHNSPIRKVYDREILAKYGEVIDVYPYRYKNIVFIGYHFECIIQGKYVVLNHFPLEIWENMKEMSYMLCGHSHNSFPRTRKESTDGLILDCGWDGHNSIYNFNEIVDIMKTKKVREVDHHVKVSI
jgi:calcineurin-like phosphoesterase family protein